MRVRLASTRSYSACQSSAVGKDVAGPRQGGAGDRPVGAWERGALGAAKDDQEEALGSPIRGARAPAAEVALAPALGMVTPLGEVSAPNRSLALMGYAQVVERLALSPLGSCPPEASPPCGMEWEGAWSPQWSSPHGRDSPCR